MKLDTNLPDANGFQQLIQDEWEARMRADPTFATYTGDHRFNHLLPSADEDAFVRRLAELRHYQERFRALEPSDLDPADRLNASIFGRLLADEITEIEFHYYRLPISKAYGFHTALPEQLPFVTPFDSIQDYDAYLSRLATIPRYFAENMDLMRTGLQTGYLPPRVTLDEVGESIRKQCPADPSQSLLYTPFQNFPTAITEVERSRLANKARSLLLTTVFPAYQNLLRFFLDEYLPAARPGISASELPDGVEFYRHRVRFYTSLDLTPEQVHQTGQDEVRRIRSEMTTVMKQVGFKGDFPAFLHFLRSEPRFYTTSPQELLQAVALILKRMDGELPRLFKTLPRTPYGIREIPSASAPGSTMAYYFPPSGDGRTAGFYYVNTYDLPSRPLYEMEALSLHEAVPGHHLQIALQQELDLPNFRRFNGFTAFVEGWALYSERLGLETGFYQDPYSNFGRLSYEMWRACRLVVDTGMHALGWTRQQAVDFMTENTSLTLLNITNEVDRYIAWPGQALAYKIGELKIRELRQKAEDALGARFNLRDFHDLVLTSGAVPLDVLETMVKEWIER